VITLYTFGPYFGLPDGSPFVTKAMLLLKMAGLTYTEDRNGYQKAPKGKLPFIDDDGQKIADTTFIRLHIEKKYNFDYDAGLTDEQKAMGWALERFCEDHLYWLVINDRWLIDANFEKGPAHFFDAAPAPLRPLIGAFVRRKIRRDAMGQGLARHSLAERAELAQRGFAAASTLLGDKPYFFGDKPHGADATLGAFAMAGQCPLFDGPACDAAKSFPNLAAYAKRIEAAYFPPKA
jgi:glutathione S-transferase